MCAEDFTGYRVHSGLVELRVQGYFNFGVAGINLFSSLLRILIDIDYSMK